MKIKKSLRLVYSSTETYGKLYIIKSVTNSIVPSPGEKLTEHEVEQYIHDGWTVTITRKGAR